MANQRNEALAAKLRRMLQEREISQAQFSARTQIKPHQLSRLLNGQRKFGRHAIEASARALQMSPAQLAAGTRELALVAELGTPGGAPRRRSAARAGTNGVHTDAGRLGSALQQGRAELAMLQAENRELTQRVAALQSQLSTCEKQCQMLRASAERRAGALAHEDGGRPAARRRAFGATLFAGLFGLGLRAVRRAA